MHVGEGVWHGRNVGVAPWRLCAAVWKSWTVKADSHIACRAHAAPHPCSDSAVSFVNVCMVAGNIRTASPIV